MLVKVLTLDSFRCARFSGLKDPAESVKAAMNQIQTMERLKVAATDEAEAAKASLHAAVNIYSCRTITCDVMAS